MAIEHNAIGAGEIHEPKGAAGASANEMYVADGTGSGSFQTPAIANLSTGAANAGESFVADGSGGGSFANLNGWANYKDDATEQTFTTTASKLSIDGASGTTETGYLPSGVTAFWDVADDKILAANVGDTYTLRIDLPITTVSGSASELTLELDIGGAATPTIVIAERQISVTAGSGKTVSVSFSYFCLATFAANGGQLFLSTDANTVGITAPGIFITRLSNGAV
jgi:hypothetical protein